MSLGELEPFFAPVSRRSLQRDLKSLLDKGLIRAIGAEALTDPNRSYGPTAPKPMKPAARPVRPGGRRKL